MLRAISQLPGSKRQPIAEDATLGAVEALKLKGVTIVDGEITELNLNYWSEITGE